MQQSDLLPIDSYIPHLLDAYRRYQNIIVKADPGTGKTTRLPAAFLRDTKGKILVLEPRRLAARLAAERVAFEHGKKIGSSVGYQIRFASQVSQDTKLIFITEGVFLRIIQENPILDGIDAVIFDEYHERHLQSDLALALSLKLQKTTRHDLRLIVMSATLDIPSLAKLLDPAKVFEIPGRTFPVEIEYLPHLENKPTESAVLEAVEILLKDPRHRGNILVFLTGIQEINRCKKRLLDAAHEHGCDVFGLTAELPASEQLRIFESRSKPMIVLATNVAETSLTLPNITGVIDTGKAKIAGLASWSGLSTLEIKPVSQASLTQRAGRAGRTSPGVAYRLFSELNFRNRPKFLAPEIQRLDLTPLCLDVLAIATKWNERSPNIQDVLPWVDAPDSRALRKAMTLLCDLGAITSEGEITSIGLSIAQMALHPRLGRIVEAYRDSPYALFAVVLASLINEGFIFDKSNCDIELSHDFIKLQVNHILEEIKGKLSSKEKNPIALRNIFSPTRVSLVLSLVKSLSLGISHKGSFSCEVTDKLIAEALFLGFPDRVAKLRVLPKEVISKNREGISFNLVTGGGGILSSRSHLKNEPWILVIEAEEIVYKNADEAVNIRIAVAIDEEIIERQSNIYTSKKSEPVWIEGAQRIDVMERSFYGPLLVREHRVSISTAHKKAVEEILLKKLMEYWPKPFSDSETLSIYHRRIALLKEFGLADLPEFAGEMLTLLQSDICQGCRSFLDISQKTLKSYIDDQLSWQELQLLEQLTPMIKKLSNNKIFPIHYDPERSPFISGYIQDFYGIDFAPCILDGKLALTLELCGPNKRPMQVTKDLSGFWSRDYPRIRAELGRIYPKHYWPENPMESEPYLLKTHAAQQQKKF